ncbi:hypothetical protein KAR91_52510 [Candidatus Pacearchaeota archaeon]|nr:hypothetical protein [Candidatus Pacearchaeota archaeon]
MSKDLIKANTIEIMKEYRGYLMEYEINLQRGPSVTVKLVIEDNIDPDTLNNNMGKIMKIMFKG